MPATHFDRSQFRRATPFTQRNLRVPGEGPDGKVRCLLIGEKPGSQEAHRGKPFIGISGQYLSIFLNAANIDRQSIYVTNLVKEFTDYSKPTAEEISRDHAELVDEIISHDPDVIGLVGGYAVQHVLLRDPEMEKCHGVPIHVSSIFGDELYRDQGWTVIPILHPATVVYQPDAAGRVLDDFLRLGQLLDGEIEPRVDEIGDDVDYRVLTLDNCRELLPSLRRSCFVGIDTEGSVESPWSIQLSTKPGTGYTVMARDKHAMTVFIEWLRYNKRHITVSLHHSLHDLPVLRAAGLDLVTEHFRFIDTMILAYLLNVEPQGLKAACYRHAMMLQDDYGEIIGDVGHQIAMDYLYRVLGAEDAPLVEVQAKPPKKKRKKKSDIEADTLPDPVPESSFVHAWPDPEPETIRENGKYRIKKSQGVTKLVTRIIVDVESGKTLKDGELVDPRERWKKLSVASKAPVIEVIGDMRYPTLDDVDFDRAIRYASRDADAQLRITQPLLDRVHAMDLDEASRIDHGIIPMVDRMGEIGIRLAPPEFWDKLSAKCDMLMDKAAWAVYEATGRDINPGSGDQVAELLYGSISDGGLGLVPPRMTDGGESGNVRGATDDKCLEELMPLAPVVEHIMDYREASKLKGTYAEPLGLMAGTGDGRARATFKLTRQITGRISTAEPMNLLSIPVRSDLGAECRYGFIASDGYVLYDADESTVEMRTFAHLSRDKKLCEIFIKGHEATGDEKEKWDVHTRTASDMFGVELHSVEKFQRQAGKVVNFFIINGGSAYGLRIQMIKFRAYQKDGSRWTEDDCQNMLDIWSKIYAGARRFQMDCVEETRQTGLARDPLSGRVRYLPQIWSPIAKVRAEAERCSYAHLIQTSANTILKRAMMAIWDNLCVPGVVEPELPVHDEILLEIIDEPGVRDWVEQGVGDALTKTTDLIVPLESEGGFGYSWSEAKH